MWLGLVLKISKCGQMGASWLLQRPQFSGENLKGKMIQRLFDVKIARRSLSQVWCVSAFIWCLVSSWINGFWRKRWDTVSGVKIPESHCGHSLKSGVSAAICWTTLSPLCPYLDPSLISLQQGKKGKGSISDQDHLLLFRSIADISQALVVPTWEKGSRERTK